MKSSPINRLIFFVLFSWLFSFHGIVFSQTKIDLERQSGNVNFSNATSTKPMRVDVILPGACTAGDFLFRLDSNANGKMFTCTSPNTWTELSAPAATNGNSGSVLASIGSTNVWQALAGDISGAPSAVTVNALRSRPIAPTAPQIGQVLVWDGINWLPQFISNSGQGQVTIKTGETTVSTSAVANFISGQGISIALANINGESRLQHSVDTSCVETRARAQSGVPLLCAASTLNGSAFTCDMSPAPSALTPGMIIHFRPGATAIGGATTLSIGALAPVPLKLSDGAADPGAVDLPLGQLQQLWYDGTSFRTLEHRTVVAQAVVVKPTCDAPLRGRIWHSFGAQGVKDSVEVCAKDETNVYNWRTLY